MPELLEPRYDHQKSEKEIYALWEKSGYFAPEAHQPWAGNPKKQKSFSIIMPPPNANGSLHLGHAVFITLQDIMTRYWRMRGRKALWLPGADHAGFETQVVFDKKLDKEGRNRFEIPREQLFKEIWNFTQENKKLMESQLRKLGASCDWSREKFTLDPDIIKIVYETFEKLYNDGLAYRDNRIVNWCVKHQTTLSELETKYVERKDPLYYIKYGPIELATVRPETKFGDTAVAVNPKDKRYMKFVGKEIEIKTLLGPAKIKVIADDAVDIKFGTGAVKVTPAHDPNDFEIWQRHKNEIAGPKVVIDKYGKIDLSAFLPAQAGAGNEKAKRYHGLKIADARKIMEGDMRAEGLISKVDTEYIHSVATCYKCGTTLEPRILPQWFVGMSDKPTIETRDKRQETRKSLRDLGIDAAEKIKFYPAHSKKIFLHWLKNIRDWNISRQIVWGIRIPAWYCLACSARPEGSRGEPQINPEVKSRWFLVRHGDVDNVKVQSIGQLDAPLNELGRKQAKAAASFFKTEKVDLIVSSDLSRARETAEAIAETTGAKIVFEKDLRERHFGAGQGITKEERDRLYGELVYSYDKKPPGGESFAEVEKRTVKTIKKYADGHKNKNIVFVFHGGPMRLALKHFKRENYKEVLERTPRRDVALAGEPALGEIIEIDLLSPCRKCKNSFYRQDSDVFDTWFSSGQWPFATLLALSKKSGNPKSPPALKLWRAGEIRNPKHGSDFETFYPTDVMETGYDILFFWVARMVMLGFYRTGKIPFKNVYLHGLVLDKDKKKMSKSKGNVIDPLGVAEIYGSDALRIALVVGNTAGNDIVISEDKIRGYRNFATKLWNISRFILMNRAQTDADGTQNNAEKTPSGGRRKSAFSTEDRENIAEAQKIKERIGKHIEKYEFHLAAETAYHYIWHTFADKIIEDAKPRLKNEDAKERETAYEMLETILIESLKMLHPFMPFVTEEIYQKFLPSFAEASEGKPAERAGKPSSAKATAGKAEKLLMVEKW